MGDLHLRRLAIHMRRFLNMFAHGYTNFLNTMSHLHQMRLRHFQSKLSKTISLDKNSSIFMSQTDVCSRCVSQSASVSVARRMLIVAC